MKIKKFICLLIISLICFLGLPLKAPLSSDRQSGTLTASAGNFYSAKQLNNAVTFLTFGDEIGFPADFYGDVQRMYQTSSISVKNYFAAQSFGALNINTVQLFDENGDCIVADNELNYYKPRYKWISTYYTEVNPVGYDNRYYDRVGQIVAPDTQGSRIHVDGAYREQMLVREVLKRLSVSSSVDLDANGDGFCDSVVIICDAKPQSDWGSILWSHMGVCFDFSAGVLGAYYYDPNDAEFYASLEPATLGGVPVSSYTVISSGELTASVVGKYNPAVLESDKDLYDVGVLCHEMMHVLGFYDYYSYEDAEYQSVGEFDLMGSTTVVPQNMLAYLRQKAGWLDCNDFLYVNDSGDYSLEISPHSSKQAIKIVLSDYHESGEYFMAEVRSQSLANSQSPFDGGLTSDGLIIYRVNESAAYINSSGEKGMVDMGNMYGDDEVYVYRVGNRKQLSDPTGYTSYAMFGSGITPIMSDFTYYDMSQFGNADKSKTRETLKVSTSEPSETALLYSDGSNSGIVFSNVSFNRATGKVTFTVTLPETQESMPVLAPNDTWFNKYLNGSNRVYWKSNVKSGKAHVMVVRSTDRLKKLAEQGKSKITFENFIEGEYSYYKVVYQTTVPLAEKKIDLPRFDEEVLIFIALESDQGNCAVRYVGCAESEPDNFKEYLAQKVDPLYIIAVASGIIILTLVVTLLLSASKKKSENVRWRR